MKHRDPTPAEQRATFLAEYEQTNGSVPGRASNKPAEPPNPYKRLSIAWHILNAARSFSWSFTLQELTVRCWERDPLVFCMKGYPAYPSETPVRNVLFGAKGMIRCGYLEEIRPGVYKLKEKSSEQTQP